MIKRNRVKDEFGIYPRSTERVDDFTQMCANIYAGNPPWIDADEGIKTINFAKAVCAEVARLATLEAEITVDGSARAKWLQEQVDELSADLRHWVEVGAAYGIVLLVPNGDSVDFYTPDRFVITDYQNGRITGAVLVNQEYDPTREKWYTRYEYHRFENGRYIITNKCFEGNAQHDDGDPVDITKTPWAGLADEVEAEGVERMLFGVLRMPDANNIDINSPVGLPIFGEAIEELKDLDIAYSRNAEEIMDSARTVLLDSDRFLPSGGKISPGNAALMRDKMGLPKYVRTVEGTGDGDIYHEINPSINTEERLKGINALLSQIGFKCGFSNGYFVFNAKTGMVTATQVESDDRRTIQLIRDVRERLQYAIDGLLYALDRYADAYALSPRGTYEAAYDFDDITLNVEEDRARWWSYVMQGVVPKWKFFVMFEGMTEDEAKEMIAEAEPNVQFMTEE